MRNKILIVAWAALTQAMLHNVGRSVTSDLFALALRQHALWEESVNELGMFEPRDKSN